MFTDRYELGLQVKPISFVIEKFSVQIIIFISM